MQVRTISQTKLPDTYGEWYKEYEKNVIIPFRNETYLFTKEIILERRLKLKAILDEKYLMMDHYDYLLPEMPKIENVEISFTMQI